MYNDYAKTEAKYKTKYRKVKAGNNSKNLLNEIKQIAYSWYQSKEIIKEVYNNIIKSIQI